MAQLSPLSTRFNVAVMHIASQLFPAGFDVASDAPDTFEKLVSHVQETGRMLVWNGASESTIFADNEVNYAFRAWHDYCHVAGGFEFTPEGETKACLMQIDHIRAVYGNTAEADYLALLVWAEVVGQVSYNLAHDGAFPVNQMAFVKHYLINPVAAVSADY
jgi:hypothetical protein